MAASPGYGSQDVVGGAASAPNIRGAFSFGRDTDLWRCRAGDGFYPLFCSRALRGQSDSAASERAGPDTLVEASQGIRLTARVGVEVVTRRGHCWPAGDRLTLQPLLRPCLRAACLHPLLRIHCGTAHVPGGFSSRLTSGSRSAPRRRRSSWRLRSDPPCSCRQLETPAWSYCSSQSPHQRCGTAPKPAATAAAKVAIASKASNDRLRMSTSLFRSDAAVDARLEQYSDRETPSTVPEEPCLVL